MSLDLENSMKLFIASCFVLQFLSLSAFGDSAVVDKKAALEWQDNKESSEAIWKMANAKCKQLHLNNHIDWRLPTPKELQHLAKSQKLKMEFDFLEESVYWSDAIDKDDEFSAMAVYMGNGFSSSNDKCDKNFVICVRDIKQQP
jgi:hypothetical protein